MTFYVGFWALRKLFSVRLAKCLRDRLFFFPTRIDSFSTELLPFCRQNIAAIECSTIGTTHVSTRVPDHPVSHSQSVDLERKMRASLKDFHATIPDPAN